ncbi:hypothetical protein Pan258_49910 [Symmachiella dynata]|uniref:hypothetical protein n=1 Tax=Symmachiella dynata TaxID=2527995 RepID=UPI001187E0EE|nr:hypothetical protein [Symmachiella dynata]QDT50909.1 hypothetical protein Pan258_49910 [Symmachiella dynata]
MSLIVSRSCSWLAVLWIVLANCSFVAAYEPADPPEFAPWLQPQEWERDTDGPIIELGEQGSFDDMHVFAPCVALEEGQYRMWYCGSQGKVAKRVFRLGLATSKDGRTFEKHPANPVFEFGDGESSILTPTLLRNADGSVLREDGKLRMWFSASHLFGKSVHNLHETQSRDGIQWSPPSDPQLSGVYAPTILKVGETYQMWYTDVSAEPWKIRHAQSSDGQEWKETKDAVLRIGQKWEQGRLFYPTVIKSGDLYLMWYGSYWSAFEGKTAIGFAVSSDGINWQKNPHNPVFRPDPSHEWESHYTTSQSIRQLPDGSWRIWYASRQKPPFVHKYFAIGTARWQGIAPAQ